MQGKNFLLINAINSTGDDKLVSVRQVVLDESVRVEVTDSGKGIAAEELPYIWDRYYKVDKSHKRGVTGTGIGLSIVKGLWKCIRESTELIPGEVREALSGLV